MTLFTPETQVAECGVTILNFLLKTADRAARLLLFCAHHLPQGRRIWLPFLQEIHKWATKKL